VVAAGAWAAAGGGGGVQLLACVSTGRRGRGRTCSDGASAPGAGDCVGAAEERSGGFGDAGAPVAGRSAARGVDGQRGNTAVAQTDPAADRAGAAAGDG